MTVRHHATEMMGYPVQEWDKAAQTYDFENIIYRITLYYEEETDDGIRWPDKFSQFLSKPNSQLAKGLIVGHWGYDIGNAPPPIESLVNAREKLPNLKWLFLGDIISEENEISWIEQANVSPLLLAYSDLEYFRIRGGNDLSLGRLTHTNLKTLIIETGGMTADIVHQIVGSTFPNLEHLELWLGSEFYGGTITLDNLRPLLQAGRFPQLKTLGLCNAEFSDEIAEAIAKSDILNQIEVLDLSMGTLGNAGMEHLLANPAFLNLKRFKMGHHFCSPEMIAKLKTLSLTIAGIAEVFQTESWGDDNGRYIAVSE